VGEAEKEKKKLPSLKYARWRKHFEKKRRKHKKKAKKKVKIRFGIRKR
jgi:hypothetical protein